MAKVIETRENQAIDLYKSHYYKTSYEKLKEAYIEFLNNEGIDIVSIDDNYFEIYAERPHFTVQAKIIEQTPIETSIDFYLSSEYLIGNTGKINKFLNDIYNHLGKKFELKGLSLHK